MDLSDSHEKIDKNGFHGYIPNQALWNQYDTQSTWERRQAMMSTHTFTDEQLKDQAIRHALAGNTAGARQTANEIVDRRHLREAWQMMLFIESERGNVQAVKDIITSCPDPSHLAGHFYLELP